MYWDDFIHGASLFSILNTISGGINTQAALGEKSIGGQLKRLIEDYHVIARKHPVCESVQKKCA